MHYDDKNRVDYNISKVNEQTVKTEYLYGEKENLAQKPGLIYGVKINGQNTVGYAYDELARIQERTLNLTTPFKTSFNYLPGSAPGTTTAMVERMQNGNDILSYTYDELGNIQTITENGELKATYYYDELNQLVREDNGYLNKTITYEYDAGGNILTKKLHAYTTGEPGEVLDEVTYQYNNANWKDQLSHCSAYGRFGYITYDAIGNPVEINDARYTWTNGRQLAAVRLANHATDYTYKYNDEGIRTQKTVEGETTNYYLNGSTILTQITGNERLDFLYDDTESLIGFLQNGTPYYYMRNLQGDIIGILDSEGNKVVSYVYDSWGSLISITGSLAETVGKSNPYRYRGYYYDEELGWYYLNSRYYDPEVGRFINSDDSDILTEEQDDLLEHNLYTYCFNNPLNMTDPSGHVAISAVIGGVLGGVTGAALGVILANMLNLRGIARGLFIAGVAVAGAALGAFLGPYVAKLMPKLIQYTRTVATKVAKTARNVKCKVKTKITKIPSCFVAGTLIKTDTGQKPIEKIEVGDLVFAEDPETGEKGFKEVVQTFVNETDELVHICVGGEEINTTPGHPFYVPQKGWVSAIELRAGDILVLSNGSYVTVELVEHEILESPVKVYNFEVKDFHTYYVGENSVLVHNKCFNAQQFLKGSKKYKDVAKVLKDQGFKQVRQEGSHVIFKSGSKTVTVPNHGGKDIASGTLRSILKQAGLL